MSHCLTDHFFLRLRDRLFLSEPQLFRPFELTLIWSAQTSFPLLGRTTTTTWIIFNDLSYDEEEYKMPSNVSSLLLRFFNWANIRQSLHHHLACHLSEPFFVRRSISSILYDSDWFFVWPLQLLAQLFLTIPFSFSFNFQLVPSLAELATWSSRKRTPLL